MVVMLEKVFSVHVFLDHVLVSLKISRIFRLQLFENFWFWQWRKNLHLFVFQNSIHRMMCSHCSYCDFDLFDLTSYSYSYVNNEYQIACHSISADKIDEHMFVHFLCTDAISCDMVHVQQDNSEHQRDADETTPLLIYVISRKLRYI